jgi:hypothetical protein
MLTRTKRRAQAKDRLSRLVLIALGAATAALAAFFDKRRRHIARDKAAAAARRAADVADRKARYAAGVAQGAAHKATAPVTSQDREYDDVTLARKVESELFRPADAPKDSVSVNVQHGVVELRGEVKRPEDIKALGAAAAAIDGVKDVRNLLHTPGSPPKHSPPSDPAEVRERAAEPRAPSGFSGNPATTPPADEPLTQRAPDPGGTST